MSRKKIYQVVHILKISKNSSIKSSCFDLEGAWVARTDVHTRNKLGQNVKELYFK